MSSDFVSCLFFYRPNTSDYQCGFMIFLRLISSNLLFEKVLWMDFLASTDRIRVSSKLTAVIQWWDYWCYFHSDYLLWCSSLCYRFLVGKACTSPQFLCLYVLHLFVWILHVPITSLVWDLIQIMICQDWTCYRL